MPLQGRLPLLGPAAAGAVPPLHPALALVRTALGWSGSHWLNRTVASQFVPLQCAAKQVGTTINHTRRFACKSDLSPEQISLPPGSWLSSLQRLEVPYEIVAVPGARRQLEAADQLEELVVDGLPLPPPGPLPAALAFIPWAAGRPRMQRLTIVLTARWRPGERSQLQRSDSSSPAGEQSDSQFALEQQVLAAMCALTAAALQAQARRPGLAVQLTRIDELHPEEMGLAWDPFA